jgi:hypothetical protein
MQAESDVSLQALLLGLLAGILPQNHKAFVSVSVPAADGKRGVNRIDPKRIANNTDK